MKRRQILSGAALALLGCLPIKPARALKFESMSAADDALYSSRCQVDPVHAELIREASDKLAHAPEARAALDAVAKDLTQALTCPYCGCNLALETQQPTQPPRF